MATSANSDSAERATGGDNELQEVLGKVVDVGKLEVPHEMDVLNRQLVRVVMAHHEVWVEHEGKPRALGNDERWAPLVKKKKELEAKRAALLGQVNGTFTVRTSSGVITVHADGLEAEEAYDLLEPGEKVELEGDFEGEDLLLQHFEILLGGRSKSNTTPASVAPSAEKSGTDGEETPAGDS